MGPNGKFSLLLILPDLKLNMPVILALFSVEVFWLLQNEQHIFEISNKFMGFTDPS